MWFIFFDILWLIIYDIMICFSFEFYIVCLFFQIYIYIYIYIFFFILIKSDKQVDNTDPFNKYIVLGLRNLDSFDKHVGLVLTNIIDTNELTRYEPDTQTRIATPRQNHQKMMAKKCCCLSCRVALLTTTLPLFWAIW